MSRATLPRRIACAALLLAAVFCWRLSWNAARDAEQAADSHLLLEAGTFTRARHAEMQREDACITLWNQLGGQTLTAPGTGRTAAVGAVLAEGDVRLLFPHGATLSPDDRTGCLLDRETARALTGTEEAAGLELAWRGARYTVRGVLDVPGATAVFRPGEPDLLRNIALEGNPRDFAVRYGDPGLTVKGSFYAELAGFFRWLPVFLAGFFLQLGLVKLCRAHREKPVGHTFLTAAAALFLTAMLLLLLRLLPRWITPARWSDFAFWGELWESVRAYAFAYLTAPRLRPDLFRLAPVLRAAVPGLLSALFLLLARRMAGTLRGAGLFYQSGGTAHGLDQPAQSVETIPRLGEGGGG